MITFLADGRLGNQLFQYAFLKTIQKNNEQIIVSGFEDLKEVFEIDDVFFLFKKNTWLRGFLFRIWKPFLHFLADKNLISSISVNNEMVLEKFRRETATYIESKGLFSFITFVKLGYFQSENFFDQNATKELQIKDRYIEEADKFLDFIPSSSNKVFIHIRRGDYKDYTVYGKSVLLPMGYFKEQIDWFVQNRENPFFIFLSDEPELIEKEFDCIKNKVISTENSFGTDLAIMTKCNSAILSPSSFGWWGSYLMQDRDIVFAPNHWLGFNSRVDYQSRSINKFMKKINIK